MRVRELMTTDVMTCGPDDDLARAARIMWEHDCGCVPVVDTNGEVRGMITDRDVCMAAYTQGKPLHDIAVHAVMSPQVFACSEDSTVEQAAALMRMKQLRRIPILDENRRFVGLLSLNDLARYILKAPLHRADGLTAEAIAITLASIGEPSSDRYATAA